MVNLEKYFQLFSYYRREEQECTKHGSYSCDRKIEEKSQT